ncbi:MAG: MscL family protein [Alphaproteobacteria bacterium]
MLKEFRDFAMRGNVVDLAIGVIIGAAFGNIVNLARHRYHHAADRLSHRRKSILRKWPPRLHPAHIGPDGKEVPATVIGYGKFINFVITFLIVAWAMFMIVKLMNAMRKKEAEKPADPPAPTTEEKLLTEIRDLLKK